MSTGTLKIHSENILPIIKKWLYSDKDIFIRELVSNSCDAIQKVKVLRDHAEIEVKDEEFRIDIIADKENKTLTFKDTGIGMDADEVEKYIAQIAFSGAEDFLAKYKTSEEKDQIIGHFGLGFYSAYMVADKVEIDTLSYKEGAMPALWSCAGSSDYEMSSGARQARGTTITLYVTDDSLEFLEVDKLKEILTQYCSFLPYPIYLNDEHINNKAPLWVKPASECTDEDYKDFYRQLYPMEPEPLFWIHLNVDYPFHLKGILYFPKIHPGFEVKKNGVKLYCNRVYVSDNCSDILPDYLTVLRGAIDSPDIPLNVSRSYLQMDRTVRQLATHISKKLCERLSSQFKSDRDAFIKTWSDIELVVKLGALQDDKFYERVQDFLLWKNSEGSWTTIEELLERQGTKDSANDITKVFYTQDEENPSHFLELYRQKGLEVIFTTSMVDNALITAVERKKNNVKFQRIDGAIDDAILDSKQDPNEEKDIDVSKFAEFAKSALINENLDVEAKSLSSETLPGFILIDEGQRRMREYFAMSSQQKMPDLCKRTFVLNTNSNLVKMIKKLSEKECDLSKDLIKEVYDLSLIAHKEMDAGNLNQFITQSNQLLEKLVTKLIN
ncbi:MAG: molecular chaperone HtpG [Parachlamydiales bacterium]|nr:molecular chaperone HtpG [Parachlamydiales bacterium]